MKKNTNGFTIVELLIVIVVIAILATISIVAYQGIQQRANNSKTLSAVNAYIKALQMYKVDNGQYPPTTSCLGLGYADNLCQSGAAGSVGVNNGNLNTTHLSPYLGAVLPSPATNRGNWHIDTELGGAIYVWNAVAYGGTNNGGIGLYHQGSGNCPSIGGAQYVGIYTYFDGSGIWCRYSMN